MAFRAPSAGSLHVPWPGPSRTLLCCRAPHARACCSQERARLRSAAEAAVTDRDVLGAQLVRRNDEVVLLQQKLRLQRATIAQGNAAYRCRAFPRSHRAMLAGPSLKQGCI